MFLVDGTRVTNLNAFVYFTLKDDTICFWELDKSYCVYKTAFNNEEIAQHEYNNIIKALVNGDKSYVIER